MNTNGFTYVEFPVVKYRSSWGSLKEGFFSGYNKHLSIIDYFIDRGEVKKNWFKAGRIIHEALMFLITLTITSIIYCLLWKFFPSTMVTGHILFFTLLVLFMVTRCFFKA